MRYTIDTLYCMGGAYIFSYIARYSYIAKDLKDKILDYFNKGLSSSIQDIYYHDRQATIALEFKDSMHFLYLERKIPEKYKYLFKEMKKEYIS